MQVFLLHDLIWLTCADAYTHTHSCLVSDTSLSCGHLADKDVGKILDSRVRQNWGLNLNFFTNSLIWTNALAFLRLSFLTVSKPRLALKVNEIMHVISLGIFSKCSLFYLSLFSFCIFSSFLFFSLCFLIPHHWIDLFFTLSYDQRRSSAMSICLDTHLDYYWVSCATLEMWLRVFIFTYPAVKWYQYSSFAWRVC